MADYGIESVLPREVNFSPISAEAVKSFKGVLAEDPEAIIAGEVNHMQRFNEDLLELLRADTSQSNDEVLTGGLVCYGLHRTIIELNGGEVPDLAPTIETYLASEHEINDPQWFENKMKRLESDKQLAKCLEEITRYNPARRFFYIGALEVLSVFDAYSEAQKLKRMVSR